jgi:hypothetical protein
LPTYFDKLNTNVRYQLTVVGQFAQAIIARKEANNRFVILTNKPGVEVSWQVTARRNDPYMRAHPFQAEQIKTGLEQGRYVYPQAYGKPASRAINPLGTAGQGTLPTEARAHTLRSRTR